MVFYRAFIKVSCKAFIGFYAGIKGFIKVRVCGA